LWYVFWNRDDVHILNETGIGTNIGTGAFAKVVLGEIQSHGSYYDWMFLVFQLLGSFHSLYLNFDKLLRALASYVPWVATVKT
jgi:hypothetical protein